jgi:hypothetical protein
VVAAELLPLCNWRSSHLPALACIVLRKSLMLRVFVELWVWLGELKSSRRAVEVLMPDVRAKWA